MIRVRELTLEHEGFSMRQLALLLAAMCIVAVVAALILLRGRETLPAGTIGYRPAMWRRG